MKSKLFLISGLLSVALVASATAQSVSVTAGNLHGSANAGASGQKVSSKNRPCNGQGMTVHSAGGNVSSSVSVSSSGGETVMAGGGSPGSTVERYDCRKTKHRR